MPIFLEIPNIQGHTRNTQYAGWFEIDSFSWGVSNNGTTSSSGGGAGKVSLSSINVTKRADVGSPLLMVACGTGVLLPAVQMVITTSSHDNQAVYETFTFSNAFISSYQISDDMASMPTESLSLNFTKIEFKQTVFHSDGTTTIQTGVIDENSSS